jgi:hypothetical protein
MVKKLPRWHKTLAWKKIGPYFVVVDPIQNKQILTLNEVAQFIWNFCDGEHDFLECRKRLVDKFDIDHETAGRDIEQFVKTLLDQGVLDYV